MSGGLAPASVPEELIRPLAEKLLSDYDSEFDASHLRWQDFAGQARELLEAVLPVHEAMLKAKFADDIDAACPCQPDRKAAFTCPVHGWAATRLKATLGQILLDLAARWRDRNDPTYTAAAEEMLDQFGDAFLNIARGGQA